MARQLTADRALARRVATAAAVALAPFGLALLARPLPAVPASAIAAVAVLLAPGLALWHALAGRHAGSPGTRLAAGVLLGAAAVAPALAAGVALHASIDVVAGVLVAITVGAAIVAALRGATPPARRDPDLAALGVVALAALPVAWLAAVAFGVRTFRSDVYYHAGRTRHLLETADLDLGRNVELVGGSVHPGYAIPLWHAYEAVIARLAGSDPLAAYAGVAAGLAVVAAATAYALGRALLGRRAGGAVVAAAAVAAGVVGPGVWAVPWRNVPLPGPAVVELLFPALLVVALADRATRRPAHLAALFGGALAATLMHPTYVPYVALVLVGAALADRLLGRRGELGRAALRVAVLLVPFAAFAAVLSSMIGETRGRMVSGDVAEQAVDRALRLREVAEVGGLLVLDPRQLFVEHPLGLLALLVLPLAALAPRRAAAYAVGGGGAVLGTMVVPPLFEALTRVLSISQSQRVALFLPLPVIVAAAAAAAAGLGREGRRRTAVLAGAGAVGLLAAALEDAAADRRVAVPLALASLAAAALALGLRAARGRGTGDAPGAVLLAVGLLALLPSLAREAVQAAGRERPANAVEVPATVGAALRALPGDPVVLSTLGVSYLLPTYADVQVYAALPKHVADTSRNDPYGRAAVLDRVLAPTTPPEERADLITRTRAGWLLLPPDEAAALGAALAADPARYERVEGPEARDGFVLYRIVRPAA